MYQAETEGKTNNLARYVTSVAKRASGRESYGTFKDSHDPAQNTLAIYSAALQLVSPAHEEVSRGERDPWIQTVKAYPTLLTDIALQAGLAYAFHEYVSDSIPLLLGAKAAYNTSTVMLTDLARAAVRKIRHR
ncbi:MAG TPA: hypothetical protein VLE91_03710 [Candidatus Saccharimonadales bacterium]|nr:hypothetical protein [Candidatus Saccharimonadales bacterium]